MQRTLFPALLTLLFSITFAAPIQAAEPVAPERLLSIRSAPNGQRPGSVLIYNIYQADAVNAGEADTEISLTNTNPTQTAWVHLFFIANGGSVADTYLCLTANQTATFLLSDVDPGVTGYIIAIATSGAAGQSAGCPISFNYLLGSENVKFRSGHVAGLPAETFEALYRGVLPGCSQSSTAADISLDGVRYSPAPRMLAVDKISSNADGNATMLILNGLGGDLAIGVRGIGEIGGVLYDDAEHAFRFTSSVTPNVVQRREILSDAFPLTTPVFTRAIPTGRTGWLKVQASEDRALTGAIINFNLGTATQRRAFNGGHNLAHLSYTSASFKVPVFPPNC